jgi:hypothetical protein
MKCRKAVQAEYLLSEMIGIRIGMGFGIIEYLHNVIS